MAKRVSQDDIIEMNEIYLVCKTYSGVAQATGWSAGTVKKYIIPNYISQQIKKEKYNINIPSVEDTIKFLTNIQQPLTTLTNKEINELPKLWKEILI